MHGNDSLPSFETPASRAPQDEVEIFFHRLECGAILYLGGYWMPRFSRAMTRRI
jgi:hypothetical protein